VGKTFLPAQSEFYANAHLKTPEHSSSSSRIEQQQAEKMRSTQACDAAAQAVQVVKDLWHASIQRH